MPHRIGRPAGVSCGSCLFVVALSVLSLSLSRLSLWRGFLPRLTWSPPRWRIALLHFRFVFIFSYGVLGWTLPTPRSTPAWFCTSCCPFDGCFSLFLVFAIGLLSRFLYPLIDWLLCRTPFTRITFFQNPGLHTCFGLKGLNFNRGLNKSHVFVSKPSLTLHTKRCFTQKKSFIHKRHAGPVQALFAAKRCLRLAG